MDFSAGTESDLFYFAVLQFIASPILLWNSFLASIMSNFLYAAAFGYYHYLSFLGYSALPFLDHTEVNNFPYHRTSF